MQIEKKSTKRKMERKKFFVSIGLGFLGIFAAKNLMFGLFSKKQEVRKPNKIKNTRVKINPLAVSRNKVGRNNG